MTFVWCFFVQPNTTVSKQKSGFLIHNQHQTCLIYIEISFLFTATGGVLMDWSMACGLHSYISLHRYALNEKKDGFLMVLTHVIKKSFSVDLAYLLQWTCKL